MLFVYIGKKASINPAIVMFMFILLLIFVIVCGLFVWKEISVGFYLLFIYMFIALGDPIKTSAH